MSNTFVTVYCRLVILQLTSGNVGVTENVEGEPRQFMVWVGTSMTSALVLHTFEVRKSAW